MLAFNPQQSLSFGGALKMVKSPSKISVTSPKIDKGKCEPIKKTQSSHKVKANLIKRTNITLSKIFEQYSTKPNNEYILRLDFNGGKNQTQTFDQWISSIKEETVLNKPQKLEKIYSEDKIKALIGKQIQNICHKIEVDNSFGKKLKQNSPQQQQTQYQTYDFLDKVQDSQNPYMSIADYNDDQVIQQTGGSLQYSKKSFQFDKENHNPNSPIKDIKIDVIEVVGLQFNHNKRFKTTKRKRKCKQ